MTTNNTQKEENSITFMEKSKPLDNVVCTVIDAYKNKLCEIREVPGDKDIKFQVLDAEGNFKYGKPTLEKAKASIRAEEPELIKKAYKSRLQINIEKRRKEIVIFSENLKNIDKKKEVPAPSM